MDTGDLLVEVNSKERSQNLINMSMILEHKVSVSPHHTSNSVKGLIYEVDLLVVSDEDISEGLLRRSRGG